MHQQQQCINGGTGLQFGMSLQLRSSLLCVRKQSKYHNVTNYVTLLLSRTDSTWMGTKLHGGIPKFQVRHARIPEFLSGGGGRGQDLNNVFLLFFSPQLTVLQFTEGVQRFYYRENYNFPRIQRGSNIFQGGPTLSRGVQLFPGGGVKMVISIKNHITCHFPGGSGPPFRPLGPHMCAVDDVIYNF